MRHVPLVFLVACASCSSNPVTGDGGSGSDAGDASTDVPLEVSTDACASCAPAGSALAVGTTFACARKNDGTVFCWGANDWAQLGNGQVTGPDMCNGFQCATSPVQVAGLTSVVSVAAGSAHACAVRTDGTVSCWGYNVDGELGSGSTSGPQLCGATACAMTPIQVVNLTGAVRVAAGAQSTCAVDGAGAVWCWGSNMYGQLGNGSMTSSPTPVQVSGLSGITDVVVSDRASCARKSDGTAWCWGSNAFGQLGSGTMMSSPTPVQVSGLSGVAGVALGSGSGCGRMADGTARCWGSASWGQLGNGTTTPSPTAVQVSGLAGATDIAARIWTVCAIASGAVECWGGNDMGQLGVGSSTGPQSCAGGACSESPAPSMGLSNVLELATGGENTCARENDGSVWCWGQNDRGELGVGTSTGPETCTSTACSTKPVRVTGFSL